MEVVLNGKTIEAEAGLTILELARQQGLEIPTLCHDEELNPYGSCWVCAVQVEGRRGFVTSCGTKLTPGMVITTDSEEIRAARKMALELLISNHYADCEAPCKIACPDHVDIQTYVSLIANGKYHEAVKVIKDTLPMPLSIGRVCPAFCEQECRRQVVEEPIAIRQLKRYAADQDLADCWNYTPEKLESNGKKVAIIGGGPSGLTCGYYLSFGGFEVDLYEAEQACGGWLRYGIPQYRLPKEILDAEIELMASGGMNIHYGKALGKDISLGELSKAYDAVYLAIGAQNAVPMPVPGSDLEGCYLGVDFLKAHALKNTPDLGKKVAIVGGGNTAIDCARTAIRLGCEVSLIYRRTKEEMPAEPFEIEAAEHEGVKFHYLCNPVEYLGEAGHLQEVRIEKMRLGDPDSSGRRRPEPTGEYFTESFDSIIAAISQVPEVKAFALPENAVEGKTIPISRWQTAVADEDTMYLGLANVFAGGDFRRGAATAIEAIADGRKAAEAIESWLLEGRLPVAKFRFDAKKASKVAEISAKEFEIFDEVPRMKMPEISVEEAASSFTEVELGFADSDALAEAARCLECGCQVNETCALRSYCSTYEVASERFMGSINKHPIDYSHPFIVRDANKCINCGRCVRTCAEIQGAAVLGFVYRGFSAVVAPEFGESLTHTTCLSCGKCIDVCPVGALVERNLHYKLNPRAKTDTIQNCGLCGVGCVIQAEAQGGEVVRISTPVEETGFNGKNLCFKGRFGWQCYSDPHRLKLPQLKTETGYQEISWQQAGEVIKAKCNSASSKRFEITPHITLEEMLMMATIAKHNETHITADRKHLAFSDPYLDLVPKDDAPARLGSFSEIVVVGELNRSLLSLIRLQQRQGKKLTLIAYPDGPFSKFADQAYAKLSDLVLNPEQIFVYNQSRISERMAAEIWNLAGTEQRVYISTDYVNHSGFVALRPEIARIPEVDFALCYGAAPVSKAGFSVAIAQFAKGIEADLLLPAPNYLEIDGLALGDNGQIKRFANPALSANINELMRLFYQMEWIHPNTADIPFWNTLAEEFIARLDEYKPAAFEPVEVQPLRDYAVSSETGINRLMADLYEIRRQPVKF